MDNTMIYQIPKSVIAKAKNVSISRLPVLARQRMNDADLPSLYMKARLALRTCHRIDEVKDVKDKHEAIAVYAKQAKDQSLRYYAERIRLRALVRIGELLNELPGNKRNKAAKDNGVATNTAKWARNAAKIPERNLDKMIEATPVPSIQRLSMYSEDRNGNGVGDKGEGLRRYLQSESRFAENPREKFISIQAAIHELLSALELAVEKQDESFWIKPSTFRKIAGSMPPREIPELLDAAKKARAFLTRLVSALESKSV